MVDAGCNNARTTRLWPMTLAAALSFLLAFASAVPAPAGGRAGGPAEMSEDTAANGVDSERSRREYNPEGLKDPFKPFVLERETVEGVDARKPRTYLETVDLSQLDLIAVVVAEDDSWAMVRDAKGIGYVVKAGTMIGTDGGRVHEIRPGEVVIRSSRADAQGVTVERETVKRLSP